MKHLPQSNEDDQMTYKVTIELEVTASNEKEAIVYAANDVTELNQIGTLEAKVKKIEGYTHE